MMCRHTCRIEESRSGWAGLEVNRTGSHVEALVPKGIQGLLENPSRVGLLRIYSDNREWVWEAGFSVLRQAIRGNDCGGRCEARGLEGECG